MCINLNKFGNEILMCSTRMCIMVAQVALLLPATIAGIVQSIHLASPGQYMCKSVYQSKQSMNLSSHVQYTYVYQYFSGSTNCTTTPSKQEGIRLRNVLIVLYFVARNFSRCKRCTSAA